MKLSQRTGFSIIELLIVISLIGLLVALILPAVQASREQSQRVLCQNNLRQIGFAVHQYSEQYRCYPPGHVLPYTIPYKDNPLNTLFDRSVHARLLPFLELQTIYANINQELSISDLVHATLWRQSVNVYLCPADAQARRPFRDRWAPGTGNAFVPLQSVGSSYTFCGGKLGSFFTLPTIPASEEFRNFIRGYNDGVFHHDTPIRSADIHDGLSQTLFGSEQSLTLYHRYFTRNPMALRYRPIWVLSETSCFTTSYPPIAVPFEQVYDVQIGGANGNHANTLHCLFGDNAVKAIRPDIDSWPIDWSTDLPQGATLSLTAGYQNLPPPGVWQSLSTRAGGEVIGPY